jgi:hypothetical protein
MATVGSTSAPSTNTIYYDALLSTTLMAYSKTLYDNIFKDSAFLAALRQYGGVRKQNGGERIALPLMYEVNSTVKSYQGEEVLDTTIQDGITTAFYEWREMAGTISITRREERQNSGEGRLIDLLQSKIRQAEMSIKEAINTQLIKGTLSGTTFVPGNSVKDLNPLAYFLRKNNQADPTTGGNVGNISYTNSWWRHKTAVGDNASADTGNSFAVSLSTLTGLKNALRTMYNYCARGSGGGPNLVVMDQRTFENYEASLDASVRYSDTKMADMGFDTIKLKGATCIWDEQVPGVDDGAEPADATDGTAFFINTEFYKLVIDSQTDIVTTPFVEPENQTAKTAKILFMGNSAVSNLRKLGVFYGIPLSLS